MATDDSLVETASTILLSSLKTKEEKGGAQEEEGRLNLTGLTVVTIASNYASDMPYFQSSHSLQMGHDNISDWLDFYSELSSSLSSCSDGPIQFLPSSLHHDPTRPESAARVTVAGVDSNGKTMVSSEWIPSAHPCNVTNEEMMITSTPLIPSVDLQCVSDTNAGGCTTRHNKNHPDLKWTGKAKGSRSFTKDHSIIMTSDGFKWRKYGKKALKHSSYERYEMIDASQETIVGLFLVE